MADQFCQFSCIFDVGTTANAVRANQLRRVLAAELDRDEGTFPGFEMAVDPARGPGALWLHSDEDGDPDHVIRFVLSCAAALDLQGVWGFTWGMSCSRLRLDAFGGGACVIDLGRRRTIGWVECSNGVIERTTQAAPAANGGEEG